MRIAVRPFRPARGEQYPPESTIRTGRIRSNRQAGRALAITSVALLGLFLQVRPAAAEVMTLTAVRPLCGISIDVSDLQNGVSVSGAGLQARQNFTLYLRPQVLGHRMSDASGRLIATIQLPPDTTGPQTIQVEGGGCAVEVTFDAGSAKAVDNPPPPVSESPISVASTAGSNGLSAGIYYGLVGVVIGAGVLMVLLATRFGRRPAG